MRDHVTIRVITGRSRRPYSAGGFSLVVLVAPAFGRGDQARAASASSRCPVVAAAKGTHPALGTSRPAPQLSATDNAVKDAESRIARNPADTAATKSLVGALLQKVREEADPSLYLRIDQKLTSLGGVRSTDPEVLLLEGTLLLARHQFNEALALGKRVSAALPDNASAYGILVDAFNELGRYDDALATTQRMVDVRPGVASFARVSYARELRGDMAGALEAMQQAVIASQGRGENAAYVQTLLGNLFLAQGNFADASASYSDALRFFPGFGPARAGQAGVLSACGLPVEAARIMGAIIETQPVLQYAMAQADYFRSGGMTKEAAESLQLVDAIAQLQRANGVDIDLEMAVYEANRRPSLALLASTRRAVAKRPSVTGFDSLAWVLYRVGKTSEAASAISRVAQLGDRDPVIRFHAAVIFLAAGAKTAARENLDIVLSGNPRAYGIDPSELERVQLELRGHASGLRVAPR